MVPPVQDDFRDIRELAVVGREVQNAALFDRELSGIAVRAERAF